MKFLIIFTILISLVSCGALDDISSTAQEVVKSNETQSELLGEIQKQGSNLQKMLELNQAMKDYMEEMKKTASDTRDKVQAGNDMLVQVEKHSETSDTNVAELVRLNNALVTSTNNLLEVNKELLGEIGLQKIAILRTALSDLVSKVTDYGLENHYRAASARSMYQIFVDYEKLLKSVHGKDPEDNLHRNWVSMYIGGNIETCDHRAKNPVGEPCTNMFTQGDGIRLGGPVKIPIPEDSVGLDQTTRRTKDQGLALAKEKIEQYLTDYAPLSWLDNYKLGKFRTNFIWTLTLRSEIVQYLNDYLIKNHISPQHGKGVEFFLNSRDMLAKHVHFMVSLEKKGDALETYQLDELRIRISQFHMLQQVFYDAKSEANVMRDKDEFVKKVRTRKLSDEEIQIVNQIEQSTLKSNYKPATLSPGL